MNQSEKKKIAIIGGGPSGLFMYKRLVETKDPSLEIDIFERKNELGAGMPYSEEGANDEHITNVSDNEIPVIYNSIADWIEMAPKDLLDYFNISSENFNEYKVLPRLFFGRYLSAQFNLLKDEAARNGITTRIHLNCTVHDISDEPDLSRVKVISDLGQFTFDQVVICSGHHWPKKHEGKIPGYFDSPYPPKKLHLKIDHPVAIMGSSLTAIDAVRTLAKLNGEFMEEDGKLIFKLHDESRGFRLVLHSRNGLLPAVRFHLQDSHLGKDETLSKAQIQAHIRENGGFISLDYIFEKNFKEMFIKNDPDFYEKVKDLNLEEFVDRMMSFREAMEPFELFKREYAEAEKSIEKEQSVYWKEALAILSFAMNYPAKYLSAEDMERLQKVLMPLISIVIAFVPQGSAKVLMALHDAGVLEVVTVGNDSEVQEQQEGGIIYTYKEASGKEVQHHFKTFVNCIGQPHLSFDDFPFESLRQDGTVSPARLAFQSAQNGKEKMDGGNKLVAAENDRYYLQVPGITINDQFQVVSTDGMANSRIYIMAVPYIGGYNPDYSGIDFSEAASETILKHMMKVTEMSSEADDYFRKS